MSSKQKGDSYNGNHRKLSLVCIIMDIPLFCYKTSIEYIQNQMQMFSIDKTQLLMVTVSQLKTITLICCIRYHLPLNYVFHSELFFFHTNCSDHYFFTRMHVLFLRNSSNSHHVHAYLDQLICIVLDRFLIKLILFLILIRHYYHNLK